MSTVQNIATSLDRYSEVGNPIHVDAGQYRPVGLLPADRSVIGWYFAGGKLVRSTDDGATWADWNTPHATIIARGVIEIFFQDDGEAIVRVQNNGTTNGESLWKSSGLATPATATWTQVQVLPGGTSGFGVLTYSYGSISVVGNVVLSSEYGPQTGYAYTNGDVAYGGHAYLSTDYGRTFTQVFDLEATVLVGDSAPLASHGPIGASNANNQHLHGCTYDKHWDRLWLALGDGGGGTTASVSGVMWSDDRGATWHREASTFSVPLGKGYQSVVPFTVEDGILFGSDLQATGIRRIGRAGYRKTAGYSPVHLADAGLGIQFLGRHAYRAPFPGSPIFYSLTGASNTSPGLIVMSPDNGRTWSNIYRDPNIIGGGANYLGIDRCFGPTNTGKLIAYFNDHTRFSAGSIFTADIPGPAKPALNLSPQALRDRFLGASDALGAASISRAGTIATTTALTSGTLQMVAVALNKGDVVGHLKFMHSGAVSGQTHAWCGLFDANRNLLAVTADQGAATIPGGAVVSLPIAVTSAGAAATFTVPSAGLYYIGVLVVGTGSTLQSANDNVSITGDPPIITGTSSASLTAPPAFPFQAGALTAINTVPYVYAAI